MKTWLENIEHTIRERKFLASLDYVLRDQQRKALGFSFTITRVEYATKVEASANLSFVKSKKKAFKKEHAPHFLVLTINIKTCIRPFVFNIRIRSL